MVAIHKVMVQHNTHQRINTNTGRSEAYLGVEMNSFFDPSILYADRCHIEDLPDQEKRNRLRFFLGELLTSKFKIPEINDQDVVFFRSLVRDDYKKSFHAVINASGVRNPVVVEDYRSYDQPARINTLASRALLENRAFLEKFDESNSLVRTILFVRACMYCVICEHFSRVRPRAVVFHADMQPIEHLLSLYFQSVGVPTVTMQHGLYVDYGEYKTVNRINYLHQPSEYFLSWGPETSELIARHHPQTRIVECGKPLIFNAAPPSGSVAPRPYVSLLLDQKPFQTQNEKMIEILRAYALRHGLDVRVRFHPSLPKAEMLGRYPGVVEQLHFTDAEFVVGHTSSLLYEALALGCRVLRFVTDVPAIPLPEANQFRTLEQLEANLALPQKPDLWRRYFCAVGDDALRRYRIFFDELLGNPVTKGAGVQQVS